MAELLMQDADVGSGGRNGVAGGGRQSSKSPLKNPPKHPLAILRITRWMILCALKARNLDATITLFFV